MNVALIIGLVYGLLLGVVGAVIFVLRLHPWRWAWLLNKLKRKAHMVAVLVDKGIPGISTVVEIGKPVKFFRDERLWIFTPKAIIEMAPDGKTIKQKFDVSDKIYKINGIPTVFFSLKDMRPLKLEGYTDEISPEEVGAIIDRYTTVRKAEAFASIQKVDLKILLILGGVALALIISAYSLYTLFQMMATLNDVKAMVGTLTAPGIHPAPPTPTGVETNTAVVVAK